MRPPPVVMKFMQDSCTSMCCHFVRRVLGFVCFCHSLLYPELILVQGFEFVSQGPKRWGFLIMSMLLEIPLPHAAMGEGETVP